MTLRSFAVVVICAVLFSTPSTVFSSASPDNPCYRFWKADRTVARKINAARRRNDLRVLKLDPELGKVARKHSKKMARHNRLSHSDEDELQSRVTNWTLLAEIIGGEGSVRRLYRRILRTSSHRAIVLHPDLRNMGTGVVTKNGTRWGTVVFTGRGNPGTTLNMPDC